MKKTDILNALGILLAMTSCGSASQYASNQKYQDGFYSRPSATETRTATLASRSKVDELVEEDAGVEGTGAGLGVELGGEEGLGLVEDALVGGVVDVEEEGRPAFGKGLGDDVVAVVL